MEMNISVDNTFGFDVHYVAIFAAQLTSWLNFAYLVSPEHIVDGKLVKAAMMVIKLLV